MKTTDEATTEQERVPPGPSRRSVLDVGLGVSALGVAGVLGLPAVRMLAAMPAVDGSNAPVSLGARSQFPENTARLVQLGDSAVLVVALPGGDFRAFDSRCSHLGCTVRYEAQKQQLECPCHGGRFALDGRVTAGPPPRPLRIIPLELRGDTLWLVPS